MTASHLLLELFLGKHLELVAEDLLRVEHLLVVHFADETLILDAVCFEEFHVGHLEGLADGLSDELSLQKVLDALNQQCKHSSKRLYLFAFEYVANHFRRFSDLVASVLAVLAHYASSRHQHN